MTTTVEGPRTNHAPAGAVLDELHQAYDNLRRLAEALQAREVAVEAREQAVLVRESEMAELLALKKIAYRFMAEDHLRALPPLPENVDLAALVKQEGWSEFKDFIGDL